MRVGGAVLWPFTLIASQWYESKAHWFNGVDEETYAIAYALAHGRRGTLRTSAHHDRRVARAAVLRWARSLSCTDGELVIAVAAMIDQMRRTASDDGAQIEENEKATTAGITAFLAANTSEGPEYWESRVCVPYIVEMMRVIREQNSVDGKPLKDDPRIIAERNLGRAIERIKREHNEANNVR